MAWSSANRCRVTNSGALQLGQISFNIAPVWDAAAAAERDAAFTGVEQAYPICEAKRYGAAFLPSENMDLKGTVTFHPKVRWHLFLVQKVVVSNLGTWKSPGINSKNQSYWQRSVSNRTPLFCLATVTPFSINNSDPWRALPQPSPVRSSLIRCPKQHCNNTE